MKVIIFNIIFYPVFFLFSAVGIPALTLMVAFMAIFLPHRRTMKRFRRAINWYGLVVIRVLPFPFVRVRYKDLAKDDGAGPYIFVCNHRSTSDPFLIGALPYELVQVVNIWPFRIPLLGIYARWAGYLSVNEMPFEVFYQRAYDLLKQGCSVVAFPEGTRSGNRTMGQFHGSIFRVALKSGFSIVPLCISGNETIPQKGSLILHPGTINIRKLPAIHWEEYKDMPPYKLKNNARDIIARELAIMDGAR